MSIVPFIVIGYAVKRRGGVETGIPKYCWLLIGVWVIYLFYGSLRVGRMLYSWCYLPDIAAATGGTLCFYFISCQIEKRTRLTKRFLSFCGVYSLVLICAPTIETYCFPMQDIIPDMPMRKLVVIAGKVAWCCVSVYSAINVKWLRWIFGIKESDKR